MDGAGLLHQSVDERRSLELVSSFDQQPGARPKSGCNRIRVFVRCALRKNVRTGAYKGGPKMLAQPRGIGATVVVCVRPRVRVGIEFPECRPA